MKKNKWKDGTFRAPVRLIKWRGWTLQIKERGLEFFFVADKKLKLENDEVIPKYSNFRTLEEFLKETNPDLLKYLKTGKHKYDQSDYSEFDI